jgi:hypothetical protein
VAGIRSYIGLRDSNAERITSRGFEKCSAIPYLFGWQSKGRQLMSGHSADLAEHIRASTINCLSAADRLEILNQQISSSTVDVPLLGRCCLRPFTSGCRRLRACLAAKVENSNGRRQQCGSMCTYSESRVTQSPHDQWKWRELSFIAELCRCTRT